MLREPLIVLAVLFALSLFGAPMAAICALLASLVALAAHALVGVRFSRFVITGEALARAGFGDFGKREWRYLLYTLLIGLVLGVILTPFVILVADLVTGGLEQGAGSPPLLATALVLPLIAWFMGRLCLVFPRVAMDHERAGLVISWRRTAGNDLPLAIGLAIVSAPPLIFVAIAEWLAQSSGIIFLIALFSILINTLISLAGTAMLAVYTGLAYRALEPEDTLFDTP
ncbi:MAG: hypothetical protein ACFB3T_01425 [Geminicoccaceae bacterium]